MQEDDQELEARLFELEIQDLADRRAELSGERWLSLIHDPTGDGAYVFRHGVDSTEGGAVPSDAEVWTYDSYAEAERAYAGLLGEAVAAGEVVDPEADDEELGDYEVDGAELNDVYDDEDTDELVVEPEPPDADALLEVEEPGPESPEERPEDAR